MNHFSPQISLFDRFRALIARLLFILCDLAMLVLAAVIAINIRIGPGIGIRLRGAYLDLWPSLGLFLLGYLIVGLYSGVLLHPADELRKLSYATSLVYLALAAVTFLLKASATSYSRLVFFLAWGFSLVLLPLGRSALRSLVGRYGWWGHPVIVLGAGKTGEMVISTLREKPQYGLKPVVCLDDDSDKWGGLEGIPVAGGLDKIPELVKHYHGAYAILAMPGIPRARLLEIIETYGEQFPHLFLIPDLFGFSSLWLTARDVGGILGLELRQQLLQPWAQVVKKIMDLLLVVVAAVPSLLLTILVSILIKLDSPGPVFYVQPRMGKGGKIFPVVKFRTMYTDADERLASILAHDESLRLEYETFHKMKNDPRITRVGRFLRKTSMDELPQVWNILRGEMSFVGPRAYMLQEREDMEAKDHTILRVLPGITGMWQVSGRNRLSFSERLEMDVYYVRNWSIWLDIYLLTRTAWVVITGEGAF
ncbi:MAG: undecaprenyl-phosphate galactose phosphotransferase WbaP [Chloroflexota bacterium]